MGALAFTNRVSVVVTSHPPLRDEHIHTMASFIRVQTGDGEGGGHDRAQTRGNTTERMTNTSMQGITAERRTGPDIEGITTERRTSTDMEGNTTEEDGTGR